MMSDAMSGAMLHIRAEPRSELSDADVDFVVAMALKRAALVGNLRAALERGDDSLSLHLARTVCGLEHQQEEDEE